MTVIDTAPALTRRAVVLLDDAYRLMVRAATECNWMQERDRLFAQELRLLAEAHLAAAAAVEELP